jgi:peptidoglycan hydrolase-like protein with peptidoglycan-binding domain
MRPVTPSTSHPVTPVRREPVRQDLGAAVDQPPGRGVRRTLTAVLLVLAALGALAGLPSAAGATGHSSYIVLAPGDHGSRVVALQEYLHVSPASGYYGPRTRQAVLDWQAAHHRNRTGLVGRLLWSAVQGSTGRAPEPSRSGDRAAGLNWPALARCESGGNPGAVNPAGYYGLYQFSPGTWRSVGGSGLPSNASSAEQTRRAVILFGRTGASSWPSCGHHLFD